MSEPYIGEIRLFAFNFAPRGWFFCEGQILPINQYSSLFSLLGTYYGGDGRNTFALPDLRGRVPLGCGRAATGTQYPIGQAAGTEVNYLAVSNLPPHTHALMATTTEADTDLPNGAALANARSNTYLKPESGPVLNTQFIADSISSVGNGHAVENRQPYLALNYCIAYIGYYPSRS